MDEVLEIRAKARVKAQEIIAYMKEKKEIEFLDHRAETAYEEMSTMLLAHNEEGKHTYSEKMRLAAATLLLKYGAPTPTQKTENLVATAEDQLEAIHAAIQARKQNKE